MATKKKTAPKSRAASRPFLHEDTGEERRKMLADDATRIAKTPAERRKAALIAWREGKAAQREREALEAKLEEESIPLVAPGSVALGNDAMGRSLALPAGLAFAMQADRPEIMTPGLCGVVAGWSEAEQRGVLALVADLVKQRDELRGEVDRHRGRADRAELRLRNTVNLALGRELEADDDETGDVIEEDDDY